MNLKKIIILSIILKSHLLLAQDLLFNNNLKDYFNKNVSFEMSVGSLKLKTNEYVYDDYYKNIEASKLNWKSSNVKLLRGNLSIVLPYNFIINIDGFSNLKKAKRGSLHDYDRVPNNYDVLKGLIKNKVPLYDILYEIFNGGGLSDQIYSDLQRNMDFNYGTCSNASLDKFYGFSFDIEKLLIKNSKAELGFGVGYGKSIEKWYALGGSGIYAGAEVDFDNLRGIEYLSKFKIPYIYLRGIYNITDKIGLSVKLKKSFWLRSYSYDYHVLRDLKFFDVSSKKNNKYHSIDLKLNYKIRDNLSIFGLYNMTKFSHHRSDTTLYHFIDNELFYGHDDKILGGIDSRNYYFSLGIKYDF